MIENAVRDRLLGFPSLAALVGTRVYAVILPPTPTLPAVTYQKTTAERISAMGADTGIARPRLQVDACGRTYDDAKSVAAQVRAALQRFRGIVGTDEILEIFIMNETDFYDSGTSVFRVSQNYQVNHRE